MSQAWKKTMAAGIALILVFALWTVLLRCVDVQTVEATGTDVGFAGVNNWFHRLTGEHLDIYELTDKLELIAIAVCAGFGVLGLIQLVRGKSLKKVDPDILLLGAYYITVILAYLLFEKVKINYRPLILPREGLEVSYPSSTTLLVLSVMPTLIFQVNRRVENKAVKTAVAVLSVLFTAFVAVGRLIAGVHWLTDILGAVFLSAGLYLVYRAAVMRKDLADGKR